MKKNLTNAAYGVLDYAAYPFGMLMVAPVVLHKLGASEYGIWTVATAVISTGGIIASRFCDANIQRVARLRGLGNAVSMVQTVRSMLGINLALGFVLALGVWITMAALRRTLLKAFACNFLLVGCGAGLLLLFGDRLIQLWASPAVARTAATILPLIVLGSSLLGLSVTGTYALLALSRFRTVAQINFCGRTVILALMAYLLRHEGLQGLATARAFYGLFALLLYVPILRYIGSGRRVAHPGRPAELACEYGEGAKL